MRDSRDSTQQFRPPKKLETQQNLNVQILNPDAPILEKCLNVDSKIHRIFLQKSRESPAHLLPYTDLCEHVTQEVFEPGDAIVVQIAIQYNHGSTLVQLSWNPHILVAVESNRNDTSDNHHEDKQRNP